jgi:hypothetical protein
MEADRCVFWHGQACDHTGEKCLEPCKAAMPQIVGLTYRDHFELFEKRWDRRRMRRVTICSIIISALALVVSAIHAGVNVYGDNHGQPVGHENRQGNEAAPKQ